MTKDEALDLALEALETLARYENPETRVQVRKPKDNGPIVTMYPHKVATDAITAIKQARALDKKAENARELGLDYEPVPENFIDALKFDVAIRDATPVQEPVAWMEMVVANLVREGVNKHKARELAEHFYGLSQPAPVQEPVAWMHWLNGPCRLFMNKDDAMMELNRLNREYPADSHARKMRPLVFGDTTPPATQPAPVQEPVEFFDWYDNAHWGNEDFKEGCHRSWNAAIKYTTHPAAPVQEPVPIHQVYLDGGWADRNADEMWAYSDPDVWKTRIVYTTPPAAQPAPVQEPEVSWGVDWGRAGDKSCAMIIKRLPEGKIEVVAVEYEP